MRELHSFCPETLLLFTPLEHEAAQNTPHILNLSLDPTPKPTSAELFVSHGAIKSPLTKVSLHSRQGVLRKLLKRNCVPMDVGEMKLREMLAL